MKIVPKVLLLLCICPTLCCISAYGSQSAPGLAGDAVSDPAMQQETSRKEPKIWGSRQWLTLLGGVAGVAAVFPADPAVQNFVQHNRNRTTDAVANFFTPFGAEYAAVIMAGFYLYGIAFDDQNARETAIDGSITSLIAGFVTLDLKGAFGRSRPYLDQGAYHFDPLHPGHGRDSFPSGHSTEAFSLASSISLHYENPWVQIVSYGVAGMVAWSRVEKNVHYPSDVAAGALIGTTVGYAVFHIDRYYREKVSVDPVLDGNDYGIAFYCSF